MILVSFCLDLMSFQIQMQEILRLLNELLPNLEEDQNAVIDSEKKTYLVGHPDILQKLGTDILSSLVQVVFL